MNTRQTIMVGITLVLAALMAACAAAAQDQPPAQGDTLQDTDWVLVSLNGNALIEGKAVTLRFGDGSIEGSGGCNTYGGSYTASGDSLSVNGVYATEMACVEPEGIMEQERAYFQALNAVARYQVAQDSGDRLELYDEAGTQVLAFGTAGGSGSVQAAPTTEPSGQSAALVDTEWVLVSLKGNALIEGREITLRFEETSIEGSGGCNTYGGSYTASEDSLSLSGVYWTEMACVEPEGIMEQEQAYFQALNAAASYRVAQDQGGGERLELTNEAGAQVLAFATSTADALVEQEMPTRTTDELSLDCTLETDETYPVGEPVNLRFALHNQTNRPLYVLTWYTPLEGMAGEILQVTRDGEKLPYQGMLAKRGDPSRDEYVVIEPGETASAEVDLRVGYDLSTPGSYQVQLTTGLQDVTDDGSLIPRKRDDHRPQSLSCNTVDFSIVPAPELPTTTPVVAATPTPEPPAGFRRYVNGASDVSLWVPESWTIIEPGPHGGSPILQSYPQDKYVGGEPRQPGDTKCDLTIHPPGTSVADVLQQITSDPRATIVSEQEIILYSGRSGIRREIESLGRSLSLYTEVNERAVVLTCFGELAPFDEIAVTLGPSG